MKKSHLRPAQETGTVTLVGTSVLEQVMLIISLTAHKHHFQLSTGGVLRNVG